MANNVTTHHYDNGRTGWNKNETVLTPLSVNRWNFGYLFQQALDDIAYAQPLYMGCLRVNGAAHSVVYVATEAGTVYAFDADHLNNRLPLWQISILGGANEVRSDWLGAITATPVIDPATNTLYVLGYFLDNNYNYTYLNYLNGANVPILPPNPTTRTGAYFFRLHAIDLITGSIKATSAPIYSPFLQLLSGVQPATVTLEVPGAGLPQDPTNAGNIYFDPGYQGSRPALLLVGGNVYAGFGSHGDVPPYHGWIIGFETQHLGVIGHFCSTPDASLTPGIGNYLDDLQIGGSFWMAGWGLAADSDGYIYGMTANGLFLDPPNVYPHNNYAESILKLDQNLNLSGSFTPANYLNLSQQDTDFGSAGPIVLPNKAGGGKFVVGCGKDANVYLVDRTSLVLGTLHTNFTSADTHALTQGPDAHPIDGGGSGPGVWGGGAYYGGPLGDVIYYCGDHGPLQSFQVKAGKLIPLQQTNTTTTTELFLGEGGVIPVVTSNGVQPQTGVVWGVTRVDTDPSLPPRLRTDTLRLRAYAAESLAQPNLVDQPIGNWGGGGAFLAPIAVNAKVYVASDHQLNVYGIVLNSTLIQSSFGTPANLGNFEALIVEENRLVHFWRDDSAPGFPWHRTVAVSSQVTGPGCLIQGTFGAPANPGNFEALILEGNNVVHYYRDNSTPGFPWHRTVAVSNAATGPATFIQGTFGAPLHPGNFEALVLEGNNLFHYYRDNTAPGFPWHKTVAVSAAATGPACLIQSTFGTPGNLGNFEALVLEGNNLVHYWRDNSTPGFPWHKTVVVSNSAVGPASFIQSTFGAPGNPGNFEALVLESNPAHPDFPPYNLVHYWRDNSMPGFPWNKSVVVSSSAIGPATLIQGTFHAAGRPGNLEVLVAEEGNTVTHYWRDDSNPALPWNSDTAL